MILSPLYCAVHLLVIAGFRLTIEGFVKMDLYLNKKNTNPFHASWAVLYQIIK